MSNINGLENALFIAQINKLGIWQWVAGVDGIFKSSTVYYNITIDKDDNIYWTTPIEADQIKLYDAMEDGSTNTEVISKEVTKLSGNILGKMIINSSQTPPTFIRYGPFFRVYKDKVWSNVSVNTLIAPGVSEPIISTTEFYLRKDSICDNVTITNSLNSFSIKNPVRRTTGFSVRKDKNLNVLTVRDRLVYVEP